MEEIGALFESARTAAGISLKEVSEDLDIETEMLENIECGKIGSFSNVFVLKEYISNYAKYLGLDEQKILDMFNEYIFESTSKIPIKEIEKEILKQDKVEKDNVLSPYTREKNNSKSWLYVIISILLVMGIIVLAILGVMQITIEKGAFGIL